MPDRGPTVSCDRRLIGQALTNLLQNAADGIAMRPRPRPDAAASEATAPSVVGTIRVSVEERGGTVRIAVADDGVGLPANDRERLVEPYVTHKPKGTGLGLAIVKKIMEDHAGSIMLDDRSEGPGAVATLILPVKLPDAA